MHKKFHVLVVCEISNAVIEQVTSAPLSYIDAVKVLNKLDNVPLRANMLQEVFK